MQMWNYAKADKDKIHQSLTDIDWIPKFKNLSSNEMVQEFPSAVMGIMSCFIPNKMIICNDKDHPWITPVIETGLRKSIKYVINLKNEVMNPMNGNVLE